MRNLTKIIRYTGVVGIVTITIGLAACSDMHAPYEEYVDDEEVVYRGKADSLVVLPGKNRVQLIWVLTSDSKINKSRVYWDERSDSLDVEVNRTSGVDTLSVKIDSLDEGSHNFEVVNLGSDGNKSLPVSATGRVYGPVYEDGLLNRPVTDAISRANGITTLEWGAAEQEAIGVNVTYTDTTDSRKSIIIGTDEETTELDDYAAPTMIEYQTMYLPDPLAIDTFYADLEVPYLVYEMDLNNTGYPVEYSEWDGDRWGIPEAWVTNEAVKIHDGYGGFDGYNGGGYFSMESWGSQPDIVNGKIYQSITLEEGTYEYTANFRDEGSALAANGDTAYVAIAAGDSLPDVWDIENDVVAYEDFSEGENDMITLEFTVDQEGEFTFGFAASFRDDSQAFRCHSVRLYKID